MRFESAVDAVVHGDAARLAALLHAEPDLVRQRSLPHPGAPAHRATLLHYIAANGVEDDRQISPPNAVHIARMLLEAGAEVDALADMYGGQHATLSMLVSSEPPARAGQQVPLVHTLLDYGAAVDGCGSGDWTSPLLTSLAFGYRGAAEALVERGARVDTLAAAAGLGRLPHVERLHATASAAERHRALALAAQNGHAAVVRFLLDAGEDPNRYNPRGTHAHSTPLHQAVWAGHQDVVRLLVEGGARLDVRDTVHQGTPLDWATHVGRTDIAAYLREQRGA